MPPPFARAAAVIALVGAAATPPAAASFFRAFSCDTSVIATIGGGNVIGAVSFATRRGKACPDGAGPDADPLGPCMPNVSLVKLGLDALPAGSRALTLENGPGIYYLYDKNASTKRWGGMGAAYYMDTLSGPAKVQGPFADTYRSAITKRVAAWFAELKKIGGVVDVVLSDFEMGYHSSSYNWAHQPTADGSDPVDALLADPRWPALRAKLDTAGLPYAVNFSAPSMKTMKDWSSADWRMTVWGQVITAGYVAELQNASVFEPIRDLYPNVIFSNFAHWHHTDPSGRTQPATANGAGSAGLWPYAEVAIGNGVHVGTHQSRGFYGGCNQSRLFATQTCRVRTAARVGSPPPRSTL